ncbi:hypothetical protein NKH18_23880 [Streptomyces sp. M10(2022)]
MEIDDREQEVVKKSYRDRMPRAITVDPYGNESKGELHAAFIPARSSSACTAPSLTSRPAARISPSWLPWTRKAAPPRPR